MYVVKLNGLDFGTRSSLTGIHRYLDQTTYPVTGNFVEDSKYRVFVCANVASGSVCDIELPAGNTIKAWTPKANAIKLNLASEFVTNTDFMSSGIHCGARGKIYVCGDYLVANGRHGFVVKGRFEAGGFVIEAKSKVTIATTDPQLVGYNTVRLADVMESGGEVVVLGHRSKSGNEKVPFRRSFVVGSDITIESSHDLQPPPKLAGVDPRGFWKRAVQSVKEADGVIGTVGGGFGYAREFGADSPEFAIGIPRVGYQGVSVFTEACGFWNIPPTGGTPTRYGTLIVGSDSTKKSSLVIDSESGAEVKYLYLVMPNGFKSAQLLDVDFQYAPAPGTLFSHMIGAVQYGAMDSVPIYCRRKIH
jgi:hypothetical protein